MLRSLKYVWLNSRFTEWNEATVHMCSHSLHYASAVFEGIRTYNGKIFKLEDHSIRLLKSAEILGIKIKYSVNEIMQAIRKTLEKNNAKNAYIRPIIWRSSKSLSITSPCIQNNLSILIFDCESPPKDNSVKIMIAQWKKMSPDTFPAQCKSSSIYAIAAASKHLAEQHGYDDSLFLDAKNNITECTTSNIFFGRKNEIITPKASNFLNGITRQTVIKLAKEMGYKVYEQNITLNEVASYDSCFLTSTLLEILPVYEIKVNNKKNHKFLNMEIVKEIQSKYKTLVT